uniref:Beta-lactamase domain-containing protein n=1 Tax=Macrostomum lignano TaxID=282301 RepID=A0A1I8IJ70_9PLAT
LGKVNLSDSFCKVAHEAGQSPGVRNSHSVIQRGPETANRPVTFQIGQALLGGLFGKPLLQSFAAGKAEHNRRDDFSRDSSCIRATPPESRTHCITRPVTPYLLKSIGRLIIFDDMSATRGTPGGVLGGHLNSTPSTVSLSHMYTRIRSVRLGRVHFAHLAVLFCLFGSGLRPPASDNVVHCGSRAACSGDERIQWHSSELSTAASLHKQNPEVIRHIKQLSVAANHGERNARPDVGLLTSGLFVVVRVGVGHSVLLEQAANQGALAQAALANHHQSEIEAFLNRFAMHLIGQISKSQPHIGAGAAAASVASRAATDRVRGTLGLPMVGPVRSMAANRLGRLQRQHSSTAAQQPSSSPAAPQPSSPAATAVPAARSTNRPRASTRLTAATDCRLPRVWSGRATLLLPSAPAWRPAAAFGARLALLLPCPAAFGAAWRPAAAFGARLAPCCRLRCRLRRPPGARSAPCYHRRPPRVSAAFGARSSAFSRPWLPPDVRGLARCWGELCGGQTVRDWQHQTLRSRRLQSARSSHGFTSAAFQPLKQAYESCCKDFESASRGGSALAVFHHGQLVADIWSGVADPSTSDEWHRRTEANAYSCSSRLLAGVCLARLSAQGYLDYSKPVADYWPELSASNNSAITVLQLLSQSEGLGESISAHAGSAHGRQSQNDVKATLGTWGLYADDYFREEVAEPHGLHIRIGAAVQSVGAAGSSHRRPQQVARPTRNWTLLWRCIARPEFWPSLRHLLATTRAASLNYSSTVAGAYGTAESFARLMSLLCSGKIVPDSSCVDRLRQPVRGMPEGNPNCGCRVGIGPGSLPLRIDGCDNWLLGCVGFGGQFLYCDPDRRLCHRLVFLRLQYRLVFLRLQYRLVFLRLQHRLVFLRLQHRLVFLRLQYRLLQSRIDQCSADAFTMPPGCAPSRLALTLRLLTCSILDLSSFGDSLNPSPSWPACIRMLLAALSSSCRAAGFFSLASNRRPPSPLCRFCLEVRSLCLMTAIRQRSSITVPKVVRTSGGRSMLGQLTDRDRDGAMAWGGQDEGAVVVVLLRALHEAEAVNVADVRDSIGAEQVEAAHSLVEGFHNFFGDDFFSSAAQPPHAALLLMVDAAAVAHLAEQPDGAAASRAGKINSNIVIVRVQRLLNKRLVEVMGFDLAFLAMAHRPRRIGDRGLPASADAMYLFPKLAAGAAKPPAVNVQWIVLPAVRVVVLRGHIGRADQRPAEVLAHGAEHGQHEVSAVHVIVAAEGRPGLPSEVNLPGGEKRLSDTTCCIVDTTSSGALMNRNKEVPFNDMQQCSVDLGGDLSNSRIDLSLSRRQTSTVSTTRQPIWRSRCSSRVIRRRLCTESEPSVHQGEPSQPITPVEAEHEHLGSQQLLNWRLESPWAQKEQTVGCILQTARQVQPATPPVHLANNGKKHLPGIHRFLLTQRTL